MRRSQDNAIAVISAYGAFRLLLFLLAVWTFFAGFSLFTQGVGALSFGGGAAAERVLGGYLLILVPMYGLLAWRREQFRMLSGCRTPGRSRSSSRRSMT